MGKCYQGVFGNWQKKVGNVVGRIVNGVNVYSVYQPNVSNPNTLPQQTTRTKFTLLTKFFSTIDSVCAIGFKQNKKNGTWLSRAMKVNFADGTTGTMPNLSLNFSKIIVSEGSIDLPYNVAAQMQGTDFSISWTDNSGIGNALETDKIMFVLYNKDKKQSIVVTDAADRSTRQATYSVPAAWAGDTAEGYLAVRRAEGDDCSMSTYLGSFNM